MVVIKYEQEYDIDVDTMWNVVSDYTNIHKVHPLIKSVDKISDNERGEGAIRTCNFYSGGSAKEKVVEWNEDGKNYKLELVDGSLRLKAMTARFAVSPKEGENATGSKVTADVDATAKYGFLGKIIERVMLKRKLTTTLKKLFAGYAYHVKTGKEVTGKESLAELQKAEVPKKEEPKAAEEASKGVEAKADEPTPAPKEGEEKKAE